MKLNEFERVTVVSARPYDSEGAMILCVVQSRQYIEAGDMLELEDGSLVTVVIYQDYVDQEKLMAIMKANKVYKVPTVTAVFSRKGVTQDEVV